MQQFCRLCLLKIPDANFVTLNNEDAKAREVRAELTACLPELQQDLVKDPVICLYCVSVLHLTDTFKTQCFNVERKIRRLQQNTKGSIEECTLTELFNIGMNCNSQSSTEINKSMIRELFSRNCDVHEVLIKEEYVSDEERTDAFSTSPLYKVSNVVMKSDVPMEKVEEQNDCSNITADIKVITGLTAHYEELARAASVSSGIGAYTVSNNEISQEMNNTGEEIVIKEEHELETFKAEEEFLNKNEFKSCTINVDLPMKDYEEQQDPLSDLMNKSPFNVSKLPNSLSEKSLHTTTRKPKSASKYERAHTHKKSFRCNTCEYSTTLKGNLNAHMRLHTGERLYNCPNCEYVAARKDYLVSHMRIHTGEKPFRCSFCEFTTAYKKYLTLHVRVHTAEKPYSCDKCDFKASWSSSLVAHMNTHTDEKPFSCSNCNFKTSSNGSLRKHMRVHTSEKPYRCKSCDFKASCSASLTRHMKNHTREKLFPCSICEFRAAQKSHLTDHMRTHTGEKPFECNICNVRVTRKGSLVMHMRTHTGEKPFHCNICEFTSSQKSHLTYHMRTHTGEKPFHCNVCEYSASQKTRLTNHMRIHTRQQSFECSICNARLTRKGHFARHMRSHTDKKTFRCNVCEFSFSRKINLTTHMLTHTGHSVEPFAI